MPLLSRRDLMKFFLWDPSKKPIQASEYLGHILLIQYFQARLPDQRLDAKQAVADQVLAHSVVDLLHNQLQKAIAVALGAVENLVNEAGAHQLVARDALALDQRLVGLADAQPLHQRVRRAALSYQAKG